MCREKILRRIKVELGKTDAEMENDPALSLANLMHFDPDAEESGDFDLVMQQVVKDGGLCISDITYVPHVLARLVW